MNPILLAQILGSYSVVQIVVGGILILGVAIIAVIGIRAMLAKAQLTVPPTLAMILWVAAGTIGLIFIILLVVRIVQSM